MQRRRLIWSSLMVGMFAISACNSVESMPQKPTSEPPPELQTGERLTIQGVRMTQGNAVNCTEVRTDDGRTIAVSYLPPAIAIGDRVEITGVMANKATCLGPVLRADETRPLND